MDAQDPLEATVAAPQRLQWAPATGRPTQRRRRTETLPSGAMVELYDPSEVTVGARRALQRAILSLSPALRQAAALAAAGEQPEPIDPTPEDVDGTFRVYDAGVLAQIARWSYDLPLRQPNGDLALASLSELPTADYDRLLVVCGPGDSSGTTTQTEPEE